MWMQESLPTFPLLQEDISPEVAIIGAGIAGLTTGYFLAKAGKNVVILEKESIGCGQTGRTTAHLTNAFDDRYSRMADIHGKEGARIIAESHTAAIDMIEKIAHDEGIECDFERISGYLFAATPEDVSELEKELVAASEAGITGLSMKSEIPWEGVASEGALLFPNQGQMHPMKYLAGLAQAFISAGGKIYEGTRVEKIEENSPVRLTVSRGYTVTAETLVTATNSPINEGKGIHMKQVPFRSYVIGIEVSARSLPPLLAWDTLEKYHYLRLDQAGRDTELGEKDILIVGGEDHQTGEENDMEERYARLEAWARKRFPQAEKVLYRWSGQVMEPADGVAFIGKNPGSPENIFIITGDSGNGMTHGTLGGKLLSDLILSHPNPWSVLYDPSRITPKAAIEHVKTSVKISRELGAWITGGEKGAAKEITKGEGTVLRSGLKKVAVYRDEAGKLHCHSAVCPHMGCIVAWNTGEKSWDCPCHGSRFTAEGCIISGPTLKDLPQAEDEVEGDASR